MPITLNGSAGVTTNSGAIYDGIQRGTAVTASGTSVDFTGIPSWVKRITVMFNGVSTNGTSLLLIQIGSGSPLTSGYNGSSSSGASVTTSTSGFLATSNMSAVGSVSGTVCLVNQTSNSWVCSGVTYYNQGGSSNNVIAGNVSLSGTLDRIRITTVNGTDTFDAGSINILYE
jgi:hypothetical protein